MRKMKTENRAQEAEKGEQRQGYCASSHIRDHKSERGVVLVVVLVLSAVALMIASALIYIVTTGTQVSGRQKAYATAREAAKGCGDIFMQLVETRSHQDLLNDLAGNLAVAGVTYSPTTPGACTGSSVDGAAYTGIAAKLMTNINTWLGCDTNINIDPMNATTYDMSAIIGVTSQYNCYAKIVATTDGNTGDALRLRTKGVVFSGGEVQAMTLSYLYAIEVLTVRTANPAERSKLSMLLQY
jgi:hypothetical protein